MIRDLVDLIARTIVAMRQVSATQWLLRLLGLAAGIGATVVAMWGGPGSNILLTMALVVICLGLLWQTVRPDSPMGAIVLAVLVCVLAGNASESLARCAAGGVLMLLAHGCWALGAVAPGRGRIPLAVLRRFSGWTGLALAVAVVAGLVIVLPLAHVHTPGWMLTVGLLAAIGLVALLVPQEKERW